MKKNLRLMEQIVKSSFWNSSSMFISRAGALIFTIILARFFAPEVFGIYTLAMSVAAIFLVFADLGINQTMIRYVSAEVGKNNKKATAYFLYLFKIKVYLALFVSGILLLLAYPFSAMMFKKASIFAPLLILSPYVFLVVIVSFFESLFFVFKKVNYLAIKEVTFQSLKLIFAVLVFAFLASTAYVKGIIFTLLLANALVLILVIKYVKKIAPFIFTKTNESIDKKRVLKFLGYSSITITSAAILSHIDVFMLGIFVAAKYIGFYKAGVVLVFSLIALLNVYYIFLPIFTRMGSKQLEKTFNQVFKYLSMITIPVAVCLILLSDVIITIIYGKEYLPAAIFLSILAPILFVEIISALTSSIFFAREKAKLLFSIIIFTTLLNIGLNYAFIRIFLTHSELAAASGAAIATVTSRTIYLIALLYLIKKKVKMRIELKQVVKPIIASAVMALVLIKTNSIIAGSSIIWRILCAFASIAVYLITLLGIKGLTAKEIWSLKYLFRKN